MYTGYSENIMLLTECTVTTRTTTTNWYNYLITEYTTATNSPMFEFFMPHWWRWYDVFRTWAKPKSVRILDVARRVILRKQERYPIGQRRKQKRRAYVQKLSAL